MPSATPKQHWSTIVAENLARRDALFPQDYLVPADQLPPKTQLNVIDFPSTCGVLTPSELQITEKDGPSLVKKMITGELNSVDVTRAFCKRATIAHQLVSPQVTRMTADEDRPTVSRRSFSNKRSKQLRKPTSI